MRLPTTQNTVVLRSWEMSDTEQLVKQANDRAVWQNLFDTFPHPYTTKDAEWWVGHSATCAPSLHLCIEVEGSVAGGVGIDIGTGSEQKTGQFGYWLGREYWGRGIATIASMAMLRHALENLPVARLKAPVFAWNARSMHVLEKIGFQREAVLGNSMVKDGRLVDSVVYSYTAGAYP